ncbi:unnamed protein product [Schistosoma spindalis]|nr:unnamed protein product [Schistosoma spindale]
METMEFINQIDLISLKQKTTNSLNVFNNHQSINVKAQRKWTMKSLLKKSKPKSEWDKYSMIDRSNWFKSQITNSPSPTRYDIKRLVNVRPISYGFKNTGRMRQCSTFTNDGSWLLPGAYNVNGVDEKLNQCHRTYSFKNIPRKFNDILFGLQDKNLSLAPGQYNPYDDEQIKKTQLPSYHSVFKSKYPRSISSQKQDNVPPPGAYNLSFNETFGIISPFVSQVPRFKRSKSFVPGPGTYNIN